MNDIALPGKAGINRHPVDQLGAIRQEIKRLQDREIALKENILSQMGSRDALGGAEYIAVRTNQSRKGGLDEAKLRKKLGSLDSYRKPDISFPVLKVERRALEDV